MKSFVFQDYERGLVGFTTDCLWSVNQLRALKIQMEGQYGSVNFSQFKAELNSRGYTVTETEKKTGPKI